MNHSTEVVTHLDQNISTGLVNNVIRDQKIRMKSDFLNFHMKLFRAERSDGILLHGKWYYKDWCETQFQEKNKINSAKNLLCSNCEPRFS